MIGSDNIKSRQLGGFNKKMSKDLKERIENIQKRAKIEEIVKETNDEHEEDDYFNNNNHNSENIIHKGLNNKNAIKKNEFSFNEINLNSSSGNVIDHHYPKSKNKLDLFDEVSTSKNMNSKLNKMNL